MESYECCLIRDRQRKDANGVNKFQQEVCGVSMNLNCSSWAFMGCHAVLIPGFPTTFGRDHLAPPDAMLTGPLSMGWQISKCMSGCQRQEWTEGIQPELGEMGGLAQSHPAVFHG